MVRTRIREDQGNDSDFLSEEEGNQRFIFRDGYGFNEADLTLDGYVSFKNQSIQPSYNDGYSHLYSQGNLLYATSSLGTSLLTPFSSEFAPILKFGETIQNTIYNISYYTVMGDLVFITISSQFQRSIDSGIVSISIPIATKNIANLNQTLLLGGFEVSKTIAIYGTPTYGSVVYGDANLRPEQVLAHMSPGMTVATLRKLGSDEDIVSSELPDRILTLYISGFYFR